MKITKDMVVFVTGGASGLGENTVKWLHNLGCKVAVADLDPVRLQALKESLGGDRIIVFECDVTKEEDVKKAIEGTAAKWGTLHVALACAGVSWPV